MSFKLITAPTTEPVSIAEIKSRLNIDHSDKDTELELLSKAARLYVERFTNRAAALQTWELTLDEFPCDAIQLRPAPLVSITSFKYDDENGDEQTISASDYYADTAQEPGWLVPLSSFSQPNILDAVNAVRVRFVAGYTPETVPETMKIAIMMLVSHWLENGEPVSAQNLQDIPFTVGALLDQQRLYL